MKDKFSNWLLGTCGRSHIGIYKCSRCGYELLRSDFSKSFVFKSPNLQGLLPVTVAAAKGKGSTKDKDNGGGGKDQKKVPYSITPFNDTMIEDFSKNFNLGKTYHKQSFVKSLIQFEGNGQDGILPTNKGTNYEVIFTNYFYYLSNSFKYLSKSK